jgi:hypothetical protein
MILFTSQKFKFWLKSHYLIIILASISFSFRYALPGDGGGNSPADDLLAVRQANSLINGDWLGPWSYLTNSKPPGMAFYLALVHFIPIPYKFVNHSLYLIAAYFFTVQLIRYLNLEKRFIRNSSLVFGVLSLNVIIFQEQFNRVYRNTPSITIVLVFYALFFMLLTSMRSRYTLLSAKKIKVAQKIKVSNQKEIQISVTLGLTFMLLQLFREDAYWILPTTFLIFAFEVYRWRSTGRNFRKQLFRSVTILLISYLSCVTFSAPIIAMNKSIYGAPVTEDYFTGPYAEAIKRWQGVQTGIDSRYFVPVTQKQRTAVYQISPTAKSLAPYLELGPNVGWKMNSCGSPIKVCDESAAWFPWELRDAAVSSGGARNAADFQSIFKKISNDIEEACDAKLLTCGSSGIAPGSKALGSSDINPLKSYFLMNMKYIFNLPTGGRISSPDRYTVPSKEVLDEWHNVVRYSPASTSIPLDKNRTSASLHIYEKIWSYIFWGFLLFIVIAIFLSIYSRGNREIKLSAALFIGSGLINAIGLSIFNHALGFFVAGSYLLNLHFNFIACSLVCLLYIVNYSERSETNFNNQK